MEHILVKYLLITELIEIVATKHKLTIAQARDKVYKSGVTDLIEDDETGLYEDSPAYLFSQFENRIMKS